ncbi:acyl-CoA thioester hydrolase/BAAT C-terminal domain-containing protein [Peptoniphilus sp. BV3C26]|uniref:acyl-CoA thioester hydrolase/BAAT C-terminal domain-containing protein n=1 Tax=Peptoniphilus sp. BV3C26 TaxID=1111134 RepID=UPI0003B9101C|nr:acyl-CoA thioester hydrolase/BAAT C-terminal domain-containing protein [Peptoniphilus sp. BV3C26]ERT57256.1 BAAT/acyl-CoA thioester hydrolase C-terminal domain protein [Peptoniphilus sp. BV3C26]
MKKIFFRIFSIAIILVVLVFILRIYNDHKYKDNNALKFPEYYKDVTDISLYPTDIDGVDVTYVDEGRMQGFRFVPKEKSHKGLVICFGGSDGGPNFETAKRLAEEGYETFALFMFGMKNQEQTLTKIPLEQFEDLISYINKNIKDNKPISVLGASKGAEYALNLASKYPEIDNLILYAPSSYNFAGLDFKDYGSSWTYKGKELPYIDIKKSSFKSFLKNIIGPALIKSPISFKETYNSAIEKDSYRQEKLIPIKDVKANILMIVGEDDLMWDSLAMANKIKEQNPNAKIYSYKGAGHIFAGNGIINLVKARIATGGSSEGNEEARNESRKTIDAFLKESHK